MKTNKNILSLGLAVALVGGLLLPAPEAKAGDREALVVAGALLGGVLGYIASDRDHGRVTVQANVGCRPPVVVYEPVVVRPRPCPPVVVYEPVVVRPRPCPPVVVVRPQPNHGHGHAYGRYDRDRRPVVIVAPHGRDGRYDGRNDHGGRRDDRNDRYDGRNDRDGRYEHNRR